MEEKQERIFNERSTDRDHLSHKMHSTAPDRCLVDVDGFVATLHDAVAGNEHEHVLIVRQAIEACRWAVLWSFLCSMAIIMEGYGNVLINSLYAHPVFAEAFGSLDVGSGTYQIEARWQLVVGAGLQATSIVGVLVNGWMVPRFGYKATFVTATTPMAALVFVSVLEFSIELQVAGQLLSG